MPAPTQVTLGLGGNLGSDDDIVDRFVRAGAALRLRLNARELRWSKVYRSAPVGPVAHQPAFINAALTVTIDRRIPPGDILAEMLAIEHTLGRARTDAIAKGPRVIDLDLLFVDDLILDSDGPPPVQVPHPRITERRFVLRPLADIYGEDWVIPGDSRTLAVCLRAARVLGQKIVRQTHLTCE